MTLAPIFLWGALLSGAVPSLRLALAFCVFHFLLYTGITAYNTFYDRDEGPIGGLERPPAVDSGLLAVALLLKGLGFCLALLAGPTFAAIYFVFVVLSLLYTHPRTRWKASPVLSTMVVCLGQGVLGFLAGWSAARAGLTGVLSYAGVLGSLSAGLTTLGMYPVTQVYQIEEDALRGDRTICVLLGPGRALRLSQACFLAAGAAATPLCWSRFGRTDASVMAAAYLAIILGLETLRRRFGELDCRAAFRTVMRIIYASSAAFAAFILFEWVRQR